jgi:protein-S-isoprenylcysteine O-methyltransferase Ste14
VLITNFILLGMIYYWQSIPTVIWEVTNPALSYTLLGLSGAGFLMVLVATFLIDHFELFGLTQVWNYWNGKPAAPPAFYTPSMYRWTRHPLYLGFMLAFIVTPRMTLDHLFFAIMTTGFMLVAIQFEEQDLIHFFGDDYRNYRKRVSMLIPLPGKAADTEQTASVGN